MKIKKKILFGIIVTTAIFCVAAIFLKQYDATTSLAEIWQRYRAYLVFLYASILMIYIYRTTHHAISNIALVSITSINFIRLMSFFTENILGINRIEFYALVGLFVGALLTTHIKHRIRYIIISIISIPFLIILINHVLPTYRDAPDFDGFYASEKIHLMIESADDSQTLKDTEGKISIQNNLQATSPTEKMIALTDHTPPETIDTDTKILFSSKTGLTHTLGQIQFPKGSIVTMFPQSALEIIPPQNIIILQGNINVYAPQELSGSINVTGALSGYTQQRLETIEKYITQYIERRNTYFIRQIGGDIMTNATIDKTIGIYLGVVNSTYSILGKIAHYIPQGNTIVGKDFEDTYTKNILNYNEFHKYIPYHTKPVYTQTGDISSETIDQTQKGYDTTSIKKRIDIIKNTINSRRGK